MNKTLATLIGFLIIGTPFAAFARDGADDTGNDDNAVRAHLDGSVTAGPGSAHAGLGVEMGNRGKGADDLKGHARDRANQEIERRLDALDRLSGRIEDAKRITLDDKATLTASIQAQIDALVELKAKIEADDSTTTLKADIESITKGHRIFLLVIPKGAITAAADRVLSVATQMEAFSSKLQARIDGAGDVDAGALNDLLDDYDAKVADAKVQANAAIDLVADLSVDNGDASVVASNTQTLKDARAKVVAAQQDLKTARQDAQKIAGAVKGHGSVTASTTEE